MEDDCNFWFESGYTRHVTFRDNEVIGCDCAPFYEGAPAVCYAPQVLREDSAEFVHGHLDVTGNTFREAAAEEGHAIHLAYLAKADITSNTFDAPFHITTHRCGTVQQERNIVKKGVE